MIASLVSAPVDIPTPAFEYKLLAPVLIVLGAALAVRARTSGVRVAAA